MSIGENIKKFRKEKGLTQKELSKHIEVTTSAIGMYESGIRNPSYEVIIKLADFFNVSVDYLLDRTVLRNIFNAKENNVAEIELISIYRSIDNNKQKTLLKIAKTLSE